MSYSKKTDIKLSKQLATTGTGARRVKAPSTASNQLLIDAPDTLKDAKTHQSRVKLPVIAPTPKPYSQKSPRDRSVGKGQR